MVALSSSSITALSYSGQEAIQKYGAVYIKSMKELVKGYNRVNKTRESGEDNFGEAVEDLRTYLNKGVEDEKPKRKSRYKLNSKND